MIEKGQWREFRQDMRSVIFNDHRVLIGPRFNISSERQCLLTVFRFLYLLRGHKWSLLLSQQMCH